MSLAFVSLVIVVWISIADANVPIDLCLIISFFLLFECTHSRNSQTIAHARRCRSERYSVSYDYMFSMYPHLKLSAGILTWPISFHSLHYIVHNFAWDTRQFSLTEQAIHENWYTQTHTHTIIGSPKKKSNQNDQQITHRNAINRVHNYPKLSIVYHLTEYEKSNRRYEWELHQSTFYFSLVFVIVVAVENWQHLLIT